MNWVPVSYSSSRLSVSPGVGRMNEISTVYPAASRLQIEAEGMPGQVDR